MFLAAPVFAASGALEFPAVHDHWRGRGTGTLRITGDGVSFQETAGKISHQGQWRYQDIQELVLYPSRLRIVTYKDNRLLLGRDREIELRAEGLHRAYDLLASSLPFRLEAKVAVPEEGAAWRMASKRLEGRGGAEGVLLIGPERLVFQSGEKEQSQTWVLNELENASSSGPLDFVVHSRGRDYRFQLKQPLPEKLYDELWRRLNLRRKT